MVFCRQVYWLLRRQWLTIKDSLGDTLINCGICWPLIFAPTTGYLMASAFFPTDAVQKGTEMMVGMLLLQVFIAAFFNNIGFLHDRVESGMLQYHVTATSYAAMFTSRFIFYVVYSYIMLLPFLPVSKLLLGSSLYTDQLSWALLFAMLFLVALMVTSYQLCIFALATSMSDIENVWAYTVEPLLWLSGMWAPVYAIAKCGIPGMSWILFFNPFAYATDALRQLFFHDARFSSLSHCVVVMSIATVVFILMSYWLLKRRLNAV